ncbi:hypothetical protein BCR32DRAFT_268906 [Anaeromyces robustus]|uniref:Periplasmic binding protein-like II n=1 Tax=Anaeromyces robustus TaxID=1754192 RepID=A0A1Y1X3R2_9FUNG|nr:hypothetical protein BCR32DRAFT_268906 [Anaeromyces robustus]|eukprot:ORX80423.1 hypothetical protein BCR32DRAFT_268906 [Anaeromyces robustus]
MNIKFLISIVLLYVFNIEFSQAITITGLVLAYPDEIEYYKLINNEFNEYAVKTDLDISLDITIITPSNFTVNLNNFSSLMDYLLNRKSKKYDLFFYYGIYNQKYGKHFLNLEDKLPREHIDPYDQGVLNISCIYNNHLIGLPLTIDIDILYSNTQYLKEYNKEIPKTWDELIETEKYIIDEERKKNNYQLSAFNGLFDGII